MQSLDKYKPKVPSVLENFMVDENLPKEEYAFEMWKNLLTAKKTQQAMFLVIGFILKEIRDKKLYLTLDYEYFNQFLESEEISFSRDSAFMYIRVYEFYIDYLKMSEDNVRNINLSRLSMMIPVLKEMGSKEEIRDKIEELNSLRHSDFVREVKRKKKTAQPSVYFSESLDVWVVEYFENKTKLMSLGNYENKH